MELTFTNKSMAPMANFAIQVNKNSFGLTPARPLQVMSPLLPSLSVEASLPMATTGAVQRMEPLTNLQVCFLFSMKSNSPIFWTPDTEISLEKSPIVMIQKRDPFVHSHTDRCISRTPTSRKLKFGRNISSMFEICNKRGFWPNFKPISSYDRFPAVNSCCSGFSFRRMVLPE
jgi:Adaptin C-terminal domain.